MEARTLNVSAPAFQPGGGSLGASNFGSRGPSPISSHAPPLQANYPQQNHSFPQHMLSQIQNTLPPIGNGSGGVMHMTAQARPFVHGNPGGFKPPSTSPNYQPASAVPIINRPVPPNQMGHAMNQASVHLTGLPTFLGTPATQYPLPSPGGSFGGPVSPLTPHGQAANPFPMPSPQTPFGSSRTNSSSNYKIRKGKGPQPVTPLKTTGHNSTPSISMNPAAFAASLAASKAKKKVVIALPNEGPLTEDDDILAREADGESDPLQDEDGDNQELLEEKRAERVKRRIARHAAVTRRDWVKREPLEEIDLSSSNHQPYAFVATCEIHPEPWPISLGLPDTIEIYLPGMSAWDEYREMRAEERLMAEEYLLPAPEPRRSLPAFLADIDASTLASNRARSLSISSPADPSMVSYKLNRYLESQQHPKHNSDRPTEEAAKEDGVDDNAAKPFGRFQTNLSHRLREAFVRRQSEGIEPKVRTGSGHGQTMSLSMPSSGGPFAPEVFNALEMIRVNSDSGPSEPASGQRPSLQKTFSDTDAKSQRADLSEIKETLESDDEDEAAAPGLKQGRGWKDLGKGFGYDVVRGDVDEGDREEGMPSAKRHTRQVSRISVSTSRRGGDEEEDDMDGAQEQDFAEEEIRTNPSEDADASDFEEEIDESAIANWGARRYSTHLSAFSDLRAGHYDGLSELSDDEDLRDSLTPSDEVFSNPSDEEAAREERMLRRQHRAAMRAARHDYRRQRARARANTDNTLPSSSIGEGDMNEENVRATQPWSFLHRTTKGKLARTQEEIISNPSDELMDTDGDGADTFGGPDEVGPSGGAARLSQDFRFPVKPINAPADDANSVQAKHTTASAIGMSTLGRAGGSSMLNPGAKEFKFGGGNASSATEKSRAVSAPVAGSQTHVPNQPSHFRLPSIKNSSFGSSALGDVAASSTAPHLNIAAPAFTPAAFTFKAPDGARLEVPVISRAPSSSGASPSDQEVGLDTKQEQTEDREAQGREKRQRYGPIDYSGDEDYAEYTPSPPRPRASAASIEGPLRSYSSIARLGPPPFNASGLSGPQRAVSAESRFTPNAPSFVPTWARGNDSGLTSGGTFKRPGLPDWGQGQTDVSSSNLHWTKDPSFFAFEPGSKAIPIRKPDEVEDRAKPPALSPSALIPAFASNIPPSPRRAGADVPRSESDLAGRWEDAATGELLAGETTSAGVVGHGRGSVADASEPAAADWRRQAPHVHTHVSDETPPVAIPNGPLTYKSTGFSFPSQDGRFISLRSEGGHAPSLSQDSLALSSSDRPRRQVPSHHGVSHYHHGKHEDDEESLTDFIEELAERVDKALEGWAGKILDEVTIMGQVRPHPRAAASENSLDHDKVVQEMSRRMEALLESYMSNVGSNHAKTPSTDASDETQSTIRPSTNRSQATSSPDSKLGSLGYADAPAEWDFDYVQETLDVKFKELQKQIENALTEAMTKLAASPANAAVTATTSGESSVAASALLSDDLTTKMSASLGQSVASSIKAEIVSFYDSQKEAQDDLRSSVQSKLDDHLGLLSERGAADRDSIQMWLESRLQTFSEAVVEVRESLGGLIKTSLMDSLQPSLEKMASQHVDADIVAARVTEIMAPMISDAREQRSQERRRSEEQLLASFPTSSDFAEETLKRIEPLVTSLKSDPIDSDALVKRLGEVIGRQSIEHMVDLSPVIALLEPLIAKQEDVRSLSKKIIQQQQEVERTLSEVPGAINAKTEIFLSSATETNQEQAKILKQISELQENIRSWTGDQTASAERDGKARTAQVQVLRDANEKLLTQLEQAQATLVSTAADLGHARGEIARFEERAVQAEKQSQDLSSKLLELDTQKSNLERKSQEAETQLQKIEAALSEASIVRTSAEKECSVLRTHIEQLTKELDEARKDRAREREASAQATAEALARAERAERSASEVQARVASQLEKSSIAEREAHSLVQTASERASKSDGQVQALEKRIAEQDIKIGNLQNLTATQKQKAATSQQKLAEAEKRAKEHENTAHQLAIAHGRIAELEGQAKEADTLQDRLRESEEREQKAREELKQYDDSFAKLEKDLLAMKELFVERTVYDSTQKELEDSKVEIEKLKAQLAQKEHGSQHGTRQSSDGWENIIVPTTPSIKSGAWASVHAPTSRNVSEPWNHSGLGQDTGSSADNSREHDENASFSMGLGKSWQRMGPYNRSFSLASSTNTGREVEVDEGGWWS